MIIYEGITKTGQKITGTFVGSKEELVEYLKHENITLINIKYKQEKLKKSKLTLEKIYTDLDQLYYLLSSGLKLDIAIKTVIKNVKDENRKVFWEEVLKDIKEGKQLSEALEKASKGKNIHFPKIYISILLVGEQIGDLVSPLKNIIEDIEFKQTLKKEIKSSLSYPIFLIVMSIGILFFIASFILPKFSEIFSSEEFNKLPYISKLVISTGKYISDNFSIIILATTGILGLVVYIFKNNKIRELIFSRSYRLPILRNILLKLELSNLFMSLSTMLKGGLSIDKAITLSKNVVNHPDLKDVLEDLKNEIKKGKKLSDVLGKYSFVPYDAVVLISAGEQSATLEKILEKLGKKYISSFKEDISKFLSILEPATIMLVGILIGFIVISILLAVLSVSDVL